MPGPGRRPTVRRLAVAIAATISVGAIAGTAISEGLESGEAAERSAAAVHVAAVSATANVASSVAPVPCGAASAATIAGVDTAVARAIYAGELRSTSVSADVAHVTGYAPLLRALASSSAPAAYAAVHAIVYTPHWHIVRLRVLEAGRVVADVGGPDVIAPVSGVLRWKGRIVGSYVMSVQDDVGYVKLVSRFIGVPIDLYRNGSFLMGTLQPAPSAPSAGGSLTVAGVGYQAHVFAAAAFPSGALQVLLLVPAPPVAVAAQPCAAVRVAAWGSVLKHIAARLKPLQAHYADLADVVRGLTGGLVVVRAGSTRLAGSAAPTRIPRNGSVSYRGRSWPVFSWEPVPPARIYFLVPAG